MSEEKEKDKEIALLLATGKLNLYSVPLPKLIHETTTNKKLKANEIVKNLWLGSVEATSESFLKEKGIKAILNCTPDEPFPKYNYKVMEHGRIPLEDNLTGNDYIGMSYYLPTAVSFIYRTLCLTDVPVLVHCLVGRERSASVIVAFLCKYYDMTVDQGYKYVLSRRPVAFFNGTSFNFDSSLKYYYRYELNKKFKDNNK